MHQKISQIENNSSKMNANQKIFWLNKIHDSHYLHFQNLVCILISIFNCGFYYFIWKLRHKINSRQILSKKKEWQDFHFFFSWSSGNVDDATSCWTSGLWNIPNISGVRGENLYRLQGRMNGVEFTDEWLMRKGFFFSMKCMKQNHTINAK